MKQVRYVFFAFILFTLSILIYSTERVPKVPMEQLTNPNSPSYVPIPYPKTDEEVIEDVKYIIKRMAPKKMQTVKAGTEVHPREEIMNELLKKNSKYKYGRVIKVKTRSRIFRHENAFLIEIIDEKKFVRGVVCLEASGLWKGSGFSKYPLEPIKTIAEVRDYISSRFGDHIRKSEILKMEMVLYFLSRFSKYSRPAWEIKTTKGSYLLSNKLNLYKYKEKISIRILLNPKYRLAATKESIVNIREEMKEFSRKHDHLVLMDTLNDELIGLERIE
ncbi:MAG: hypothetical protein ACFFG0_47585 [Candidatus Thorarchaeota archaeon]